MRSSVELQMCQLSTFRLPNGISIPHCTAPSPSSCLFFPLPLCHHDRRHSCVRQWGCLWHGACCPICCNFLGTFLILCLQLTLQFVKVTPAPPTTPPSASPLALPPLPSAITPTSIINHAPCSKCSGGVSLSLSLCLLRLLNGDEGGWLARGERRCQHEFNT